MTECFYVATEFDQGEKFLCRDRIWPWMGFLCHDIAFYVETVGHGVASQQDRVCARQALGARYSVAPCCVTTSLGARTTRDCAFDRGILSR